MSLNFYPAEDETTPLIGESKETGSLLPLPTNNRFKAN
jgi:hypothetical protein